MENQTNLGVQCSPEASRDAAMVATCAARSVMPHKNAQMAAMASACTLGWLMLLKYAYPAGSEMTATTP